MFFEALGRLLGQSGDAIASLDREADAPMDAREERELRQIGLLLRRVQGVWGGVFETLEAETAVLDAALKEANEALSGAGLPTVERGRERDPLGRYRDLERSLDAALAVFVEHSEADWARRARQGLRSRLREAAEIQGRLTDAMLAIR